MKALLSTLPLFLLAACGAPNAASPSGVLSDHDAPVDADVEPGTFQMFVSPGGPEDDRCTFFTELTLANGFQSPVAQLVNGVTGTCNVRVEPNRRAFNLGVSVDACGTKHLVSEGLKILDHRQRTCKDIVQAKVILIEEDQGFLSTLYSADRAVQGRETRTEQGLFMSLQAIGGETTGYGLKLTNGDVIELDLATHGFAARFVEGARFEVTGQFKTVQGVEIPTRKVLVVTSLTSLD